jgi:hypothetical protein
MTSRSGIDSVVRRSPTGRLFIWALDAGLKTKQPRVPPELLRTTHAGPEGWGEYRDPTI